MPTTIQVSETTKQMLDMLKEKGQKKTHDTVIQQLLKEQMQLPKSMYGSVKGLKWKKEDRAEFHEL